MHPVHPVYDVEQLHVPGIYGGLLRNDEMTPSFHHKCFLSHNIYRSSLECYICDEGRVTQKNRHESYDYYRFSPRIVDIVRKEIPRDLVTVVGQRYAVNVMDEHVLRGNAAIIKCHIPSFVAEFVEVDSWVEDETTVIYPKPDYGTVFSPSSFCFFFCLCLHMRLVY